MSDFIDSRPQRLCKMCGTCCRVATTPKSYQELLALAEAGDKGAKDFLTLFVPYESIEEARKVSAATVDNILEKMLTPEDSNQEITFYHCKHIQDNNLCGIYKERLELCDRFPSTAWAVAPPGCGFEGWLFQKREEIKQRTRKQKEYKLEFEAMLKETDDPEKIEKLKQGIAKIDSMVEMLSKYGSKDW